MAEQTFNTVTKDQAKALVALKGPTVWVLDDGEARPTTGGPTGTGVQVGDLIFRRPA